MVEIVSVVLCMCERNMREEKRVSYKMADLHMHTSMHIQRKGRQTASIHTIPLLIARELGSDS